MEVRVTNSSACYAYVIWAELGHCHFLRASSFKCSNYSTVILLFDLKVIATNSFSTVSYTRGESIEMRSQVYQLLLYKVKHYFPTTPTRVKTTNTLWETTNTLWETTTQLTFNLSAMT